MEISLRYAWLYRSLPTCLKWAGMAAFASHHIRFALLPLRVDADRTGYVDIPRSRMRRGFLLAEDVNTIRATNNAIRRSVFGAARATSAMAAGYRTRPRPGSLEPLAGVSPPCSRVSRRSTRPARVLEDPMSSTPDAFRRAGIDHLLEEGARTPRTDAAQAGLLTQPVAISNPSYVCRAAARRRWVGAPAPRSASAGAARSDPRLFYASRRRTPLALRTGGRNTRTTSRTLASSWVAGDLNVSDRHGCRPQRRQNLRPSRRDPQLGARAAGSTSASPRAARAAAPTSPSTTATSSTTRYGQSCGDLPARRCSRRVALLPAVHRRLVQPYRLHGVLDRTPSAAATRIRARCAKPARIVGARNQDSSILALPRRTSSAPSTPCTMIGVRRRIADARRVRNLELDDGVI